MMRRLLLAAVLSAPAFAASAYAQGVTVEQPWARATAPHADTGAVYASFSSSEPDTLTGASTPVAGMAMLHETTPETNGVMRMREKAGGLALKPGQTLVLKPGADHLMLMGLRRQLQPGDSFPVTFSFAHAAPVTVTVRVGTAGASGPPTQAH